MRRSLRNVCVCVASGCAACALLLGISSCQTSQALFASAGALGVLTDNTLLTAVGTSGASIARAAEPISAEQEYYIGRVVAATLLESYQLYENAELTEYVNSVCQTLALNSERPELFNGYYAAVLDTDQINAFATSGGHILITRGLLACTDSEDSLAAVLAHEIAHIQLQHSIKAIKTSRTSDAVLTTAAGVLAEVACHGRACRGDVWVNHRDCRAALRHGCQSFAAGAGLVVIAALTALAVERVQVALVGHGFRCVAHEVCHLSAYNDLVAYVQHFA